MPFNTKKTLITSLMTACGLSLTVGCASQSDYSASSEGTCQPQTIKTLEGLRSELKEAQDRERLRWSPAKATSMLNELEQAIADCDRATAQAVIAKAEEEKANLEREAERMANERRAQEERDAERRMQQENERYLAMAEEELARIETYDNLSAEQQERLREGRDALDQREGRKSYTILSNLHASLKDRVEEYIVKEGDTLWDIASRDSTYGNPWQWPAIHDENRNKIDNPDMIFPGQTLMIDKNAGPTDLTAQARKNNLIQ